MFEKQLWLEFWYYISQIKSVSNYMSYTASTSYNIFDNDLVHVVDLVFNKQYKRVNEVNISK